MVRFKELFRFSKKEVLCAFKLAKIQAQWRGLKLLQIPPNYFCKELKVSEYTFGKLLIIIPSSSGKAHQRNLLRRQVKNIFYSEQLYQNPVISILIVYKNGLSVKFDQLRDFLIKNLI